MKYLFLDTNIFLHYIGYEDIPWAALLGSDDDITIVVAGIVVREIDKHKDGAKSKLKERAKKISNKFKEVLVQRKNSRIPIIYFSDTPISEEEQKLYDITVNDDRFLLNVLHFTQQNKEAIVVSNDTDMILKAQGMKLCYLYMDEKYRSAEQPTNEELEIKRLKAELEQKNNRISSPQVIFADTDSTCLSFPVIKSCALEDTIEPLVALEASRFPEKDFERFRFNPAMTDYQERLLQVSKSLYPHREEDIKHYNEMRESYLQDYRVKVSLQELKNRQEKSFKELKFQIYNGGTAQTGDLHVTLVFPDNSPIYLLGESKKSFAYKNPVEPVYIEYIEAIKRLDIQLPANHFTDPTIDIWDTRHPSPKTEFSTTSSKIMHGFYQEWNLGIYVNTEVEQEFEITWIIADSTHIEHLSGVLKVIVSDEQ